MWPVKNFATYPKDFSLKWMKEENHWEHATFLGDPLALVLPENSC